MTKEDKIRRIQSHMKLVVNAQTYRDALNHCCFIRGTLSAWTLDGSLDQESYKQFNDDLEVVMEVKRKLPVKGDVL